jgi:hypothetical protein
MEDGPMRRRTLAAIALALAMARFSFSQSSGPSLAAVRVEHGPVLDGRLSDDVWTRAVPFADFKMVFPKPGSEPSEKTELRVLFDEAFLYIGVSCRDREPLKIAANTMAHDAWDDDENASDDLVRVLLDPFQDKRNAYIFFVNPRGARSEGLAFGEHFSLNWDGLWDARSRVDSDGWCCELKIPFKTLSFKPGLAAWGINVERYIPRKQETIRLSGTTRNSFFYNAREAATLEGVGGVRQGLGLTFRPYGIASRNHGPGAGTGDGLTLDGGFDLYKNVTPNFVGAFSYNMDFAETEVDERRINLTRFPLYFPEKRTFFLEGSEIFNFGGGGKNFYPFFSRRIGLYEGDPVPVRYGLKFFGKLGQTNLSVLDVKTDALNGLAAENYVAARVVQNVLDESKVGIIFTNGSPSGEKNTIVGIDATYQTSRFFGDQNLNAGGWYVANWTGTGDGSHRAYGIRLDYPNDLWDCRANYAYYGEAFSPGLGFLARPNGQSFETGFSFQPRPRPGGMGGLVRQFFFELELSYFWDLSGHLETREIFTAPLNLRTESGEHIEFNIMPNRDVLPYDFEVAEGVILPRGAYDFTRYRFEFNSAMHRPWTVDLSWRFGQFYSGHYDDVEAGFGLKFKGYATVALAMNFIRGRLPEGRFSENVYQLKADVFFSPDLGLMTYFQYDDVSKKLGANARFRWRISPGNEVFLVYTKNWERRWDPTLRFVPAGERGVFKITLSLRP